MNRAPAQSVVAPRFRWLKFGDVMPSGWIKAQMEQDLREGFAGHLDQLAPHAGSDIFDSGRNAPGKPNLPGQAGEEGANWGNGESEGNWRTGHIMMAYMSGNAEAKRKADAYVTHILQTQDEDGYIGIYSPELRYPRDRWRTGEIWTQTCLFRGLLAYYEFTGKTEVLDAVERAVRRTLCEYGPGKMSVFGPPGTALTGFGHDLMSADAMEQLYDLTGDASYRDFGLWLYQDFCAHYEDRVDASVVSLLDLERPLTEHGPSTLEHCRVPLWAYFVTGDPDYKRASENVFIKVRRYLLPGGAAVSQEVIESPPDPTKKYYEYCAMKELLATWCAGLQKTGEGELGDSIEKLVFNAMQGARSTGGKGITYCTRDNRYAIEGELHHRSKFSPAHTDVAICCNPNATQTFPLFVRNMWMRTPENGLAAMLYGPSSVRTTVNGIEVQITERTDYPFSSKVLITVDPERPVDFPLLLRNPAWSGETRVRCEGATVSRQGDYFLVRKGWRKGDQISLEFSESIVGTTAANGEVYLQRGPLVYALRIPEIARKTRDYDLPGFADLEYVPTQDAAWSYALESGCGNEDFGFAATSETDRDMLYPYDGSPVRLEGKLINLDTGKKEAARLIPMGSHLAILRRVTFPVKGVEEAR
ncbi:MAG: beta-L-arabinofuranosidase domain-containing protein [Candidatus Latescibacterota bacterium]